MQWILRHFFQVSLEHPCSRLAYPVQHSSLAAKVNYTGLDAIVYLSLLNNIILLPYMYQKAAKVLLTIPKRYKQIRRFEQRPFVGGPLLETSNLFVSLR